MIETTRYYVKRIVSYLDVSENIHINLELSYRYLVPEECSFVVTSFVLRSLP